MSLDVELTVCPVGQCDPVDIVTTAEQFALFVGAILFAFGQVAGGFGFFLGLTLALQGRACSIGVAAGPDCEIGRYGSAYQQ